MTDDTPSFHICGHLATAATLRLDGSLNGGTPYDEAMLKLTHTGELYLILEWRVGGDMVPVDEWHGRTLTWSLLRGPGELDVLALRRDLEPGGELHESMRRLTAGQDVDWDSRNYVGVLNEDAEAAHDALCAHFDEVSYGTDREVWDADVWLGCFEVEGLTGETTDDRLRALVESVERWAEKDDVLLMDVEDALRHRRDELRDAELGD